MDRAAPNQDQRTPLPGHRHVPLPGEKRSGGTDPGAELQVTLILRRRHPLPDLHSAPGDPSPRQRQHLSPGEFARKHGARKDDIARVSRFARRHQLELLEVAAHRRAVVLGGKAAAMEHAFGVRLLEVEHPRGNYRAAAGRLTVPRELAEIVRAVLGLNTRPCAKRPRVHYPNPIKPFWTVPEMARAYGFPATFSAAKQRIGLIELGGGYHEQDLQKFFTSLHRPMPAIHFVSVDGVGNSPAPPHQMRQFFDVLDGNCKLSEVSADVLQAAQSTMEVTMDIELAAALAPGAEIVVYMASNSEQGIYNAVSRAISGKEKLPCALSISWGEPETQLSRAYLKSLDELLRDAAMLGVAVCVSSGDQGAMNGSSGAKPGVNFPASSPHVLSCGGTMVQDSPGKQVRESAWNCDLHGIRGATGGGVSQRFPVPRWQKKHGVPLAPNGKRGRGVPDVAGPADPRRGCKIIAGGRCCPSAGTSAVAPLWAALVACLNATLGTRCGYITPLLYELAANSAPVLREITRGNNGFYHAGPGWNACTGLGSPKVESLIEALRVASRGVSS
jgi:kumamolisin